MKEAKGDLPLLQGPPGAGKSAFTLRLSDKLAEEGLHPLRIRLRYLDLSPQIPLLAALAKVVLRPDEDEDPALSDLPACRDPLLGGQIFQERTKYGNAEICPYVVILDGWDEISLTSNEGFRGQIIRLLDRVRAELLDNRRPLIRVLLTGRPSDAIEDSQFLKSKTPVLTVRAYATPQLLKYIDKIAVAVTSPRFSAVETWPNANWNRIRASVQDPRRSGLEVLQSPLLAHLALWLLAQKDADPDRILDDTTELYRNLVDLTCAENKDEDFPKMARIRGIKLRRLLHKTAIAITLYGQENIPFNELNSRLDLAEGALESVRRRLSR